MKLLRERTGIGVFFMHLFGFLSVAIGLSASSQVPQEFRFDPPKTFVTDIEVSESLLEIVQEQLGETFFDGIRSFDWGRVAQGLSTKFWGTFPTQRDGRHIEEGSISARLISEDSLQWVSKNVFVERIREQVGAWTSVERLSWQVFEFRSHTSQKRAFMKAHFQLGGPDVGGARAVFNATVTAQVVLGDEGSWQFDRFAFGEGSWAQNSRVIFRDITDAVGFHFNRSRANEELRQDIVDTRSSLVDSSLGVVDWNHDGFWDVLVTEAMNQGVLFLNDGKGGFSREDLPFDDNRLIPSQVLFVDLDGDGFEELVGNRVLYRGRQGFIGIYTRRDGEWLFLPNALQFDNPEDVRRMDAQPMTVADVNGDGLLDILIAGYETDQSRRPGQFNRVDASDGARSLLFINQGDLSFMEESAKRGIFGSRYTYVAGVFDFDGDGDVDIFEGNDYGRNRLWDNDGTGIFQSLESHPFTLNSSNTMGMTIADWNNDGFWGLYLSNMYSHAGSRVIDLTDSLGAPMQRRLEHLAGGNQLFELSAETGEWIELGSKLSINEAGWAWASLFLDIDNDGDKELFVTNGNTSHSNPETPDY